VMCVSAPLPLIVRGIVQHGKFPPGMAERMKTSTSKKSASFPLCYCTARGRLEPLPTNCIIASSARSADWCLKLLANGPVNRIRTAAADREVEWGRGWSTKISRSC
jgi:hypothetical protein